jgi:peptidoglycan/xylan/chitin deacetylase (PgdA/CDA1 family)/GT2 family glycosyltransferase
MPELSVIIATYNRAAKLQACLLALARQTLPAADFEVIVVMDGSTDDTRSMLTRLSVPYALKVIWQANSGQCAALNRGLAEAAGPYCLFIDDDVAAEPALLAEHLRAQRAQPNVVGLGRLELVLPEHADRFARSLARIWANHYAHLRDGRPATWTDSYSGNLSAPRAALLAVGGFALELTGSFDLELGYRLAQHGLSFVYLPEAAGQHDDYKDFARIAADMEKHGRSAAALCQRHPEMLPALLGDFGETSLRALWLRRVLLRLNVSARVLRWLSRLLSNRPAEFEWYLFLHRYFYWRGARQVTPDRERWRRLTARTPILMYHAFAAPGEPASRFIVAQRSFALQMAWLKLWRYQVLSLEEFVNHHLAHTLPPARAVVITIDDGYAENYTLVYPILKRHQFPATIFLVTALVGGVNRWDQSGTLAGRPLLGWPDIAAMRRGGLHFGAHTRTHVNLARVAPDCAREEIAGSRADLEQALQAPVRLFAYPFGAYDNTALDAARQADFLAACSVRRGPNSPNTPAFELRRTEVYGTDSLLRFALALWLGDDHLQRKSDRGRAA